MEKNNARIKENIILPPLNVISIGVVISMSALTIVHFNLKLLQLPLKACLR